MVRNSTRRSWGLKYDRVRADIGPFFQSERFGADPNSWRLWAARIRRADAGIFGGALAEAASDRLRHGVDRHRCLFSLQRRARGPAGFHAAGASPRYSPRP